MKPKGGENVKIKEVSHYTVETADGTLLKKGFKDLHDAHEFATNEILAGRTKVIIKAEIEITKQE
jgi:hypothetical protein